MSEYVKFDIDRQDEFKVELTKLLLKYDVTIDVIISGDSWLDSVDICDRCGVGLSTELSELGSSDIDSMESIT